ncbi:hypothetical protein EV363DRAFT_1558321 [Boletus edulis]|nr:hypothetical protein EV363DRAFT_1558321 [Boletus edulis]
MSFNASHSRWDNPRHPIDQPTWPSSAGWGVLCRHDQWNNHTVRLNDAESPSWLTQYMSRRVVQNYHVTRDASSLWHVLRPRSSIIDDPNTDLYVASIAHNFLLYHLTRLANTARISDFSPKDLYPRDPERTRFILSAFIKFVKFTEQCTPFVAIDSPTSVTSPRPSSKRGNTSHKNSLQAQHAQGTTRKGRAKMRTAPHRKRHYNRHDLMATKETTQAVVKDIEALKIDLKKENTNSETSLL